MVMSLLRYNYSKIEHFLHFNRTEKEKVTFRCVIPLRFLILSEVSNPTSGMPACTQPLVNTRSGSTENFRGGIQFCIGLNVN